MPMINPRSQTRRIGPSAAGFAKESGGARRQGNEAQRIIQEETRRFKENFPGVNPKPLKGYFEELSRRGVIGKAELPKWVGGSMSNCIKAGNSPKEMARKIIFGMCYDGVYRPLILKPGELVGPLVKEDFDAIAEASARYNFPQVRKIATKLANERIQRERTENEGTTAEQRLKELFGEGRRAGASAKGPSIELTPGQQLRLNECYRGLQGNGININRLPQVTRTILTQAVQISGTESNGEIINFFTNACLKAGGESGENVAEFMRGLRREQEAKPKVDTPDGRFDKFNELYDEGERRPTRGTPARMEPSESFSTKAKPKGMIRSLLGRLFG